MEPKFFQELVLGRPYKKVYFSPVSNAYFLYVDDLPTDWDDEKREENTEVRGMWCPHEAMGVDNSEEPACFGVMVCPLEELGTVIHECSHAALCFVTVMLSNWPEYETFDEDEQDQTFDEWLAIVNGILAEQLLCDRPYESILEEYDYIIKVYNEKHNEHN